MQGGDEIVRHPGHREGLQRLRPPGKAQACSQIVIEDQSLEGERQGLDIAGLEQESRPALLDDFGESARARRDDGQAVGPRLHDAEAETLVDRGGHENVERVVDFIAVADEAGPAHRVLEPEFGDLGVDGIDEASVPVADDRKTE